MDDTDSDRPGAFRSRLSSLSRWLTKGGGDYLVYALLLLPWVAYLLNPWASVVEWKRDGPRTLPWWWRGLGALLFGGGAAYFLGEFLTRRAKGKPARSPHPFAHRAARRGQAARVRLAAAWRQAWGVLSPPLEWLFEWTVGRLEDRRVQAVLLLLLACAGGAFGLYAAAPGTVWQARGYNTFSAVHSQETRLVAAVPVLLGALWLFRQAGRVAWQEFKSHCARTAPLPKPAPRRKK